jgi:hypothetical protein
MLARPAKKAARTKTTRTAGPAKRAATVVGVCIRAVPGSATRERRATRVAIEMGLGAPSAETILASAHGTAPRRMGGAEGGRTHYVFFHEK